MKKIIDLVKYARNINLNLFLSWLTFSARSRVGFKTFLASIRVLGIIMVFLRFIATPGHNLNINYYYAEILLLVLGITYSVILLVYSKKIIEKFDYPKYHVVFSIADTLLISCYIFVTNHATTEIYLLFFLPLIAASHFLDRRLFFYIGMVVALSYGIVLSLMFFLDYGFGASKFLNQVAAPWAGKTIFLLAGALAFRAQRGLPGSNVDLVVSPAQARKELELMLDEVKSIIPYVSASIQMIYRDRLMVVACRGFQNEREIYQLEFPTNDPRFPNKQIIELKQVKVFSSKDFPSFQDENYKSTHVKTWLGIPLVSPATDECFGIISLDSEIENAYGLQDLQHAKWFAHRVSNFLTESALAPAALTQTTNRENLFRLLKIWANVLPNKTITWDDDAHAARELAKLGKKIFHVEDCSIYFRRQKIYNYKRRNKKNAEDPALLLIASTSIPEENYREFDEIASGLPGDGLAGFVAHSEKTINYDTKHINSARYKLDSTEHVKYLPSNKSRQIMINPLYDSQKNITGAIKIENRMGTSSESEFFTVERNLFEVFADMTSMILETIRQRNYIKRIDHDIHNMRELVHRGAIMPLLKTQGIIGKTEALSEAQKNIGDVIQILDDIKIVIHRVLTGSIENLHLEKEGLMHALYHEHGKLHALPDFEPAASKIIIRADDGVEEHLPYAIKEAFFNVAREAMLNIVRHSRIEDKSDGYGEVRLAMDEDVFTLSIKDNGEGFDETAVMESPMRSFGIHSLKEEMKYKKYHSTVAKVSINSKPGMGTHIIICWSPKNIEKTE